MRVIPFNLFRENLKVPQRYYYKRIEVLVVKVLIHSADLEIFKLKTESKSRVNSHKTEIKKLFPEYEKRFMAYKKACVFFQGQPPSYRKVVIHLIMTAMSGKTRVLRSDKLITESE